MSLASAWTTSCSPCAPPPNRPACACSRWPPGRILRHGVHRDPRPVAAPPVAPPEAAVRRRAAGARARRAPMSGSPCPAGTDGWRWRATCWPACRRTTRSWQPTAARPPACWPSAPASPPRASAARAPTGTRCARSTCRPRRWKPRCCALVPPDAGRLLDIGTGTGRVLELLAPRVARGPGRGCHPGDAGAGPRPPGRPGLRPLRGAAGRHVPPAAGRCGVRPGRCCRWCCTTPRTPPARWPRRRACCGPAGG